MSDRTVEKDGLESPQGPPSSSLSATPSVGARAQLVQASFERVLLVADVLAELFYARLFLLDPSLRPMFRGDMKEQGRKLVNTLRMAVHALERLDRIVPTLEAMGRRHVVYGVKNEHYDTVREALLWALGHALHGEYTPAVAGAWAEVYDFLASTMKRGAADQALSSPPPSQRTPLSQRLPLSQPPLA